jgi:isopentenyl-diphosphate delta-isomerase
VEQLRAGGLAADIGQQFSGWGIPTAAAVATVRRAVSPQVTLIASGGIRTGLDIAKSIALGADLAGLALPLFRAQQTGGVGRVVAALQGLTMALKQAMLLTGVTNVQGLKRVPKVLAGELKDWLGAV